MVLNRTLAIVVFLVGAAAIILSVANAQTSTRTAMARSPDIQVVQPSFNQKVDKKIESPEGLAWEASTVPKGKLWIADTAGGKIVSVLAGTSRYEEFSMPKGTVPGPLTFDKGRVKPWTLGNRLWVLDRAKNSIIFGFKSDPAPDTSENPFFRPIERGIAIEDSPRRPRIRGIAVYPDRDPLQQSDVVWICRGGGLCSTIEVWNLKTKRVLARFFPRCEPIDIAIDPGGDRLWILANNGDKRNMLLLERRLKGRRGAAPWEVASGQTRRFMALPKSIRPVAMAASSDSIWVLTKDGPDSMVAGEERAHLYQFPVGRVPSIFPDRGTP